MAGRVAPQPEVAGRIDQSLAEVPEPGAIDDAPARSAGSWGRRSPEPSRADRSLFETAGRSGCGEQPQESPRHGLSRPARVAPDEDVRIDRLRGVVDHHRRGPERPDASIRDGRSRRLTDRAVRLALDRETPASRPSTPGAIRRRQRALAAATPSRPRAGPARGGRLRRVLFPARLELGEQGRIPLDDLVHVRGRAAEHRPGDQRMDRRCLGVGRAGQLALDFGRPGRELVLGQTGKGIPGTDDRVVNLAASPRDNASTA